MKEKSSNEIFNDLDYKLVNTVHDNFAIYFNGIYFIKVGSIISKYNSIGEDKSFSPMEIIACAKYIDEMFGNLI